MSSLSQAQVFYKSAVLKNFTKLIRNNLCGSLFLINFKGYFLPSDEKRDSGTGAFLWILRKFLKQIFQRTAYISTRVTKTRCIFYSSCWNWRCSLIFRPIFFSYIPLNSMQLKIPRYYIIKFDMNWNIIDGFQRVDLTQGYWNVFLIWCEEEFIDSVEY